LGVGRLAGVKQFDRLVTAFAVACSRGLQARLVIAGGGPERTNLERLIATYGVQDRVILAGYWWARVLTGEVWRLSVSFALPAAAGTALGILLFNHVDHARFRQVVFAVLFVSGAVLLIRG